MGVVAISKPASSMAPLIASGDKSFEWLTVTDCETIETHMSVGGGESALRVSSMVWTQLPRVQVSADKSQRHRFSSHLLQWRLEMRMVVTRPPWLTGAMRESWNLRRGIGIYREE